MAPSAGQPTDAFGISRSALQLSPDRLNRIPAHAEGHRDPKRGARMLDMVLTAPSTRDEAFELQQVLLGGLRSLHGQTVDTPHGTLLFRYVRGVALFEGELTRPSGRKSYPVRLTVAAYSSLWCFIPELRVDKPSRYQHGVATELAEKVWQWNQRQPAALLEQVGHTWRAYDNLEVLTSTNDWAPYHQLLVRRITASLVALAASTIADPAVREIAMTLLHDGDGWSRSGAELVETARLLAA
jgi:hypothetical protein